VLPPYIQYSFPNVTLTSPGADAIGNNSAWSKMFWLGGRVKIDAQLPVSKNFTVTI
jgi:hypothetical protein